MTKDRTEELRAESSKNVPKYKLPGPWNKDNQEEVMRLTPSFKRPSITRSSKKKEGPLDGVFKEVNLIQNWIGSIKENTSRLKQCHKVAENSSRPEIGNKDKMTELMANVRSFSSRAKGGLEGLRRREASQKEDGVKRVIETQLAVLSKAYQDAIEDYHMALVLHKEKNQDIIKKHLFIVVEHLMKRLPCVPADKEVTHEQLSDMLDSEDTAVFADDYLKDTAQARQLLLEAKNRYLDIVAIEKEILEIRNLFFDIAAHVHNQGELIDRIDFHVRQGVYRAHDGADLLLRAKKNKKRARKKKIMLYLCLSTVCLVILLCIVLLNFPFE